MTLDLHPAAADMARVVAGVTDLHLDRGTPCPEMDVRTMLAHVAGFSAAFRDCAAKIDGPTTGTSPQSGPPELAPDWRTDIPRLLTEMADAWDAPEAWEGDSTVGGVTSPAAQNGLFANDELVVHAWDLAVATGQTVRPTEANLAACHELASGIPADSPARAGGLFGRLVDVPHDAPLLDRALAATGRDPHWKSANGPGEPAQLRTR